MLWTGSRTRPWEHWGSRPLPPQRADLDPELPHQAPKVQQGVRQRPLCGDVGLASVPALPGRGAVIAGSQQAASPLLTSPRCPPPRPQA